MLDIIMGTSKPVRLFLSPSGRSPLSPSLINIKNRVTVNRISKRKLDFSYSPANSSIENKYLQPPIDFKHLDYEISPVNNLLVINSPNKSLILKHGLQINNKKQRDLTILGKGAFGTVVRGFHNGKEVAVKIVKSKYALNEANALILDHENVIKTLDLIAKNEDHSIIIMEFLESGRSLQSLIDDDTFQLDYRCIVRYCIDICQGLQHCHEQNILHLDLKPANVLVCDGVCKICDFGNSAVAESQSSGFISLPNGTVQYTAPEVLMGKLANFASDIFSLGIVFWQLRYREVPYANLGSRETIIYRVVKYGMRPNVTKGFRKEIDDTYAALYKSCWHQDTNSRPSLATISNALGKF